MWTGTETSPVSNKRNCLMIGTVSPLSNKAEDVVVGKELRRDQNHGHNCESDLDPFSPKAPA